MSAAFTDLLPPTRSEKHGAFVWEPAADTATSHVAGVLTITGKRCHCCYRVSCSPANTGRGFLLAKLAAGSDRTEGHYSCFVAGARGLCECRGFLTTGRCKHLESLTALVAAGRI
jgi:hypothetical protein